MPINPVRGYPPGAIDGDPDRYSGPHQWHDYASVGVFLRIPAAAVVSTATGEGWWCEMTRQHPTRCLVRFDLGVIRIGPDPPATPVQTGRLLADTSCPYPRPE